MSNEKFTVDAETAEVEFDRFCDAMDLEFDESQMDEETREQFRALKRKFITAVRKGVLEVNDSGEPEVKLSMSYGENGPTVVKFREPRGSDFMQVDRAKKNESAKKSYLVMASITGQPVKLFGDMRKRDLDVCQAVIGLFMD